MKCGNYMVWIENEFINHQNDMFYLIFSMKMFKVQNSTLTNETKNQFINL